VTWSLDRRELGFFDWRQRLALGPDGTVWIGGSVAPGTSKGLLYRLQEGRWSDYREALPGTERTFVLDVDSTGTLWFCDYSRTDESTYRGLRIRRFDGQGWHEDLVKPGIWPQAMDMISPDEGWIGGNNGSFLHWSGGRWRRETLDLPEGQRRGLNILALRMAGPGDGWAVGAQGLVARYREGRWRVVPVPAALRSEALYDLDVSGGRLWVVGSRGLLASRDGSGWRRWARPVSGDLLGIEMVSPDEGWAVGAYGTILRFDGKGWHPQISPTAADLYDIALSSPDEGWIAGEEVLLRSTPGGPPLLRQSARLASSPLARQPGQGAAALDMDGDGDLDLFSLQSTALRGYENRGAKGFAETLAEAAPPLQGASWGDVDGDGDPDLLALGEASPKVWLHRNRGRGRFTAAEELPLEPLGGTGDTAHLVDLDRDGNLDLYLARSALPGPKRLGNPLYRNDGGGRFTTTGGLTGDRGIEMFALWGDLDGDLDLDGVLPGNGNELRLLRNEDGRLRDATAGSGLDAPLDEGQMFQGSLLDLDVDGDLDLLVLGHRLYAFVNDGRARFRRDDGLFGPVENNPAFSSRMSNAGDLDHDGFPEVLLQPIVGSRPLTRLFSRGPDGRYRDIASRAGLSQLTGNAAVFADWDADGDLDLYVTGDRGSSLFENGRNDSSFLKVRLRGDRSNRLAVGARVLVYETGHLGERRRLRGHQQLGVGFNPSGVQSLSELHFGLDSRRRYDVEVTFPSGRRVLARNVATGRTLTLHENPPGLRHFLLGQRWARRAWLAADLRREAAKLALVLLILSLGRRIAARRLGARSIVPRWSVAAALVATYLLAAGELAGDGRLAVHAGHLLGFTGALALLAVADQRITGWKVARYLGPYRLHEVLGEGGMGMVYRARNVVTGQTVALKVLHPRRTAGEGNRLRFLREARILTRLEHPNIVRVFDTGEIGGRGFISMELLAGVSLRELVERRGPLPCEAVRALLAAALDALGYVHRQGIVHRDVKSDNLFLLLDPEAPLPADEEDWRRRVKLMDFGLARSAGALTLTGHQALLGTLAYMPPELLRGQPPDARSDLYSLGVAAYEALTGRLPFEGEDEATLLARIQTTGPVPLRTLRPDVPADLEERVHALMAREPSEREPKTERSARESSPPGSLSQGRGRESSLKAPLPWERGWGEDSRADEQAEAGLWQARFEQVQALLAENRSTEAQVLLMECLADLKQTLLPLEPGQRDLYCQQHGVAEVLALAHRLNP
jgi:serine/threonine protein kinase